MPTAAAVNRDELAAQIRDAGIRPTAARVRVLEELAREPRDASAQAIHARLRGRRRTVGIATVYRALNELAEADLIDALAHGGEMHYRLCGGAHHHHLVCSRCHRVIELTDCDLDGWLDRVGAQTGFTVTDHTLEVVGVCSDCAG
jgi:Fur family ferric uptake transcriptional regulator